MYNKLTQEYLFSKHAKIFIQHKLPMEQTCMCWGLEIGDGWYPVIDELCENIQTNVDSRNIRQIEALQVKEKFGGLRFYANYHDEEIYKLIRQAEYKASKTCVKCSSPGKSRDDRGWTIVLCNSCYKG